MRHLVIGLRAMTNRFLAPLGLMALVVVFATSQVQAVSFSVVETSGVEFSALDDMYDSGAEDGSAFNSDGGAINTLGAHGDDLGTSLDADSAGENQQIMDAMHFGPGVANPQTFYFSMGWVSAQAYAPPGSGYSQAPGTGIHSANVYASLGDGWNVLAYEGNDDLGMKRYESSCLNAFELNDVTGVSTANPLYFSISADQYGYRQFAVGGSVTAGPGDILKSTGDGTYSVYVPAAELGLANDADIDALARLADGSWLFSLHANKGHGLPGSAADLARGTRTRQANIYRSEADGTNELYLHSSELGISHSEEFGDYMDVNAFDLGGALDADAHPGEKVVVEGTVWSLDEDNNGTYDASTIDSILFTVTAETTVFFDTLVIEQTLKDLLVDLNGDGEYTGMNSLIRLFDADEKQLAENWFGPSVDLTVDCFDASLEYYFNQAGTYRLTIGQLWYSEVEALAGISTNEIIWHGDTHTHADWTVNITAYDGTFAVVPEPATMSLLAIGGLGALLWYAWRRRR